MKLKKASSIIMFIMLYSNIMLFCAFPNPMVLGGFLQEFVLQTAQNQTEDEISLAFEFEDGNETEEQTKDAKKINNIEEEILHEVGVLDNLLPQNMPLYCSVLFEPIRAKSQLGFSRLLLPPPELIA